MESNNSDHYDNSVTNYNNGKEEFLENNHVNGLSNGYSKDKGNKGHKFDHHKDKHKDRDKHRSKDHKSSSSSSKDKDKHKHSSHHKSSNKDKDRKEDKHKDKKSSDGTEKSSKERSERSDREKSSKDKSDKERSDREKEKSDREKDKNDKDKERGDKHREEKKSKEKEHKSSKDKEKSKDKEGREKDKHRHSSSRDKDKHSSKDKHRDKDKHASSKDKKEKEKKVESYEPEPISVRDEKPVYDDARDDSLDEDEEKLVIKEESESIDEEQHNDLSQASSCDYSLSQFKDEPKEELKEEPEEYSEEDIPLSARFESAKRKIESEDDEDDAPLSMRKKTKKKKEKKLKKHHTDDEVDFKPVVKKETKRKSKAEENAESPRKRKKKEDEQQEVWKWWEEEKKEDGVKWTFLEHKGPVFAPAYERLPTSVKFFYNNQEMRLSDEAEEVAGFYAKMLDHDYTTKAIFNNNFFKDWRLVMTDAERAKITDLDKCNFKAMHAYFMDMAEKNRNRSKEEKAELKAKNENIVKEYGFCIIDGHKEKIGNFKIEPPGLFRGRGEHPKMGKLKKRIMPEDILINCSKDSKIPKAPPGHKWKEVRHDNTVTWLASWTENVQNQAKYVMLNPSSKLKGEKDWQKYETARRLHKCIDKIRREYREDWKSKEMRIRQRAVALYFIDKLALRAGNEKDEDQADTVGCCSLRVEHIQLHETKDDKSYVVVFDFLGKDSIRYYNEVPVEKRVFKNLQLFMENKSRADDLFDRLNTAIMNKHLNELMEGLTAKVFRTYNASFTLQQQLDELTNPNDSISEKILSYNRANRAVAILCNHQRSVPKGHEKSMEKLKEKIQAKKDQIHDAERQVKDAQRDAKHGSVKEKVVYDKKKKMLQRLKDQLVKLTVQETDRDENKTIALGTSKLNYLDPRISVAWCKKNDVPIEKIYNKTQRDKFRWAIDMAGPDYVF